MIDVAVHLSNGEYSTIYTYSVDDYQDYYEGDDDFALIDEF